MTKRYQRGDAGAAMLAVMVIVMIGFFWQQGRGHGGWGGHMSGEPPAVETGKSALELLDEAYARGELSREEYLQKREDLKRP